MKKIILPILVITIISISGMFYFSGSNNPTINYPMLQYNFEPGDKITYTLDFKSSGSSEIFTPDTNNSRQEKFQSVMHLKADMIIENIAINKKNNYLVEYLIKPKYFNFTFGNKIIEKPKSILVSVVMQKNGRIKTFYMDSTAFELYGNVVRELLAVVEFVVPESAVALWSVSEKNIINEQLADYKIKQETSSTKIYDINKSYRNGTEAMNLSGGFLFSFNNDAGLIDSIYGTKKIILKLPGNSSSASESSLKLNLTSTSRIARSKEYINTAWNRIKVKVEETLMGKQQIANMHERANQKVLGDDDLTSLREKLIQTKSNDHAQLTALVEKLTALLQLRPEMADEVAELLNDYQWQDGQWGAIAASLTFVSTKESQLALINALDNASTASGTHLALMPHLAFVDKPIVQAEEYFRNLKQSTQSEEVVYKSNNALGIIASNLREEDKPRAILILNELSIELESAQDSYKKVSLIEAIGNIGLSEQTPILQNYISSSDNNIKVPAIFSLRFINTDESRDLLTNYLVDKDEKIRESAALALEYTTGDSGVLAVYEQRLKQETSITILKSIISNLSKMATDYPRSLDLIDAFIKICANRDICGYAKSIRSMKT